MKIHVLPVERQPRSRLKRMKGYAIKVPLKVDTLRVVLARAGVSVPDDLKLAPFEYLQPVFLDKAACEAFNSLGYPVEEVELVDR